MKKEDILLELNSVFSMVFEKNDLQINERMNSGDIDEWDSLNHATLIAAIEKHFGIRFKLSEMMGFKSVEKILLAIDKKISEQK
jgi:acyl carrier protein